MSKRDEVWVMLSSLFLFGERRESLGGGFRFAGLARRRKGVFFGVCRACKGSKWSIFGVCRACKGSERIIFGACTSCK